MKDLKNNTRRFGWKVGLVLAAAVGMSATFMPGVRPALAATGVVLSADEQSAENGGSVVLELGKAKTVTVDHKIKKANILAPEIADVVPLNPTEVLVTAKKPGSTQLIIWDENDHYQVMAVVVQSNIVQLRKQLTLLFPDAQISAEENAGGITLHGQVHSLQIAQQAEMVAAPYGKVLNLLEVAGGQQVMLKVRFAEVSKQAETELGFNFGGTDGITVLGANLGRNSLGVTPGTPGPPPTANQLTIPSGLISTASLFGTGAAGSTAFAYFIDALKQNSLLRVLAEPNLVTTSGQEATFLAGGSIPYPVPQGSGGGTTITIQWQDYGVNLKFTPIVLGNGQIRIKVAPEVSQLDYAHSVDLAGTPVPALTKRNISTVVELGEGQTFAVAGLLQNNITANASQFPLLGDIPILGSLFRSVSYQRNETELVVLVTPELVHGMDPADVSEVPGGKWRDPSDFNLFFRHDLGGEEIEPAPMPSSADGEAPRFHGEYGFQPATAPSN